MMENRMQNFNKICKKLAKEIFVYSNVSIKSIASNEIGILFEGNGFIIESTKNEDSIKIYLRKRYKPDLLIRSFFVVYGDSEEKMFFEKGYNKFFFDSDTELKGILIFLKKKYDSVLQSFFSDDSMYLEIEKYFENKRKSNLEKSYSPEETQKFIIETISFSKRIRFTQNGSIYMIN